MALIEYLARPLCDGCPERADLHDAAADIGGDDLKSGGQFVFAFDRAQGQLGQVDGAGSNPAQNAPLVQLELTDIHCLYSYMCLRGSFPVCTYTYTTSPLFVICHCFLDSISSCLVSLSQEKGRGSGPNKEKHGEAIPS